MPNMNNQIEETWLNWKINTGVWFQYRKFVNVNNIK